MRWQPALLAVLSVVPLTSAGCYRPPPPAVGCPAGHASYQAGDVAIRLGENDAGGRSSLRLPLGKVVVVMWPGICASGDALQGLGSLQAPNVQGRSYASAFLAVKIGKAELYRVDSCGEVCMKPFSVGITVTTRCEVLSRKEVTARWLSGGPDDWTWSAKLIQARQYEQLFATLVGTAPGEPVWAVLATGRMNLGTPVAPTPGPIVWVARAVDGCTDYDSGQWSGTSEPAGWSSVTDQSPT
jgi:hypothetical protein